MNEKTKHSGGFTLVEVIVVLVILAILAAIMIPSMTGWIDKAKEKGAYTEIRTCALAARSAYDVIYAKHSVSDSEQFFYGGGSATTGINGEFQTEFKGFLNDADMLANVKMVMISKDVLGVQYTYNGSDYYYRDMSGTVTITKQ